MTKQRRSFFAPAVEALPPPPDLATAVGERCLFFSRAARTLVVIHRWQDSARIGPSRRLQKRDDSQDQQD
ncbi:MULTISPECIES: hypothetical protein [Pseudomonas]|uniref:hypothetical protein n=1 Tax=Pseudomonas TaxID=286 RepID=UPI001562A293|nr:MULTISPECIES: hypothetical protein [Pseudomonas]